MESPDGLFNLPVAEASTGLVVTESARDVMLGLVPWLRSGSPVLLVGPEGCGKAHLLQHCFKQLAVGLSQRLLPVRHAVRLASAAQLISKLFMCIA